MSEYEQLSLTEIKNIKAGLKNKTIRYFSSSNFINILRRTWEETEDTIELDLSDLEKIIVSQKTKDLFFSEPDELELEDSDELPEERSFYYSPEKEEAEGYWDLGFGEDFFKSIQKFDRKLKGRILETFEIIRKNPISPKGNTVKPLTSELKGFWRIRVGDYRLIYYPDNQNRKVTLLSFSPRGSVYS